MGCAALTFGIGCTSSDPSDDDLPDVVAGKADGNGITQLQSVQIKDVGSINAAGDHLHYTGHPRYIGAKIHADQNSLLQTANQISQEEHPTIVVADADLNVLVKVNGGTLAGGPGFSVADATFAIPSTGTYWLLFGEQNRQAFTLDVNYELTHPAGSSCSHASDCTSDVCTGGVCRAHSPVSSCTINADCTTNVCDTSDNACQFSGVGGSCTGNADCNTNICTHGTCTCIPPGPVPAELVTNVLAQCCGGQPMETESDGSEVCL